MFSGGHSRFILGSRLKRYTRYNCGQQETRQQADQGENGNGNGKIFALSRLHGGD